MHCIRAPFKPRPVAGSVAGVETDVLGTPYEQRRLILDPDDEGEVVATLVSLAPARRAGGRCSTCTGTSTTSSRPIWPSSSSSGDTTSTRSTSASTAGACWRTRRRTSAGDVSEYYPEIDEAVRIIRDEDGHDTLLLNGHSTGGLTAALWADRVRGRDLIQGVFLNSPFFEFNEPWLVRRGLAPSDQRSRAIPPVGQAPPGARHDVRPEHPPRPSRRVGLRPGVEAAQRLQDLRRVGAGDEPGAAPRPERPGHRRAGARGVLGAQLSRTSRRGRAPRRRGVQRGTHRPSRAADWAGTSRWYGSRAASTT